MSDKFDYAEPACPLCDGKDFYYPKKDAPIGRVPVGRIIERVDSLFGKNDSAEAGRLLEYWRNEAVSLKDKSGELALESELVGFYRKQGEKVKALTSVKRALELVSELHQTETASGGTILVNCATAYKAFGMSKEAIPLYKKAESIYERTLSKDDSRFGGLYNNMALALADEKEYDEAERAYFRAISVMEKAPNGEAECAITYINLAYMYYSCRRDGEIDECMSRAHELLTSESLPRNGYYAFVLEKCAPAFADFGQKDIAEKMKKEAEKIYARA